MRLVENRGKLNGFGPTVEMRNTQNHLHAPHERSRASGNFVGHRVEILARLETRWWHASKRSDNENDHRKYDKAGRDYKGNWSFSFTTVFQLR